MEKCYYNTEKHMLAKRYVVVNEKRKSIKGRMVTIGYDLQLKSYVAGEIAGESFKNLDGKFYSIGLPHDRLNIRDGQEFVTDIVPMTEYFSEKLVSKEVLGAFIREKNASIKNSGNIR